MKKLKFLLRQPEFHGLLFVLSLILFSYPLLVMSNASHPKTIYLSLFLPWGIIILLLFLTSRSYPTLQQEKGPDHQDGDVTDV